MGLFDRDKKDDKKKEEKKKADFSNVKGGSSTVSVASLGPPHE